jgi:hypothetical protein
MGKGREWKDRKGRWGKGGEGERRGENKHGE